VFLGHEIKDDRRDLTLVVTATNRCSNERPPSAARASPFEAQAQHHDVARLFMAVAIEFCILLWAPEFLGLVCRPKQL
jgi:hypothetical protein